MRAEKCIELLNKRSPRGQNFAKLLTEMERKIRSADMIVPFPDLQGTGKSTVLNALRGEPLLAVEADETTCVPVRIRHGDMSEAEVLFSDGRAQVRKSLPRTRTITYRPGTEENAERIVL